MYLHLYGSSLRNESRIERSCNAIHRIGPTLKVRVAGIREADQFELEQKTDWLEFHRTPLPPKKLFHRGPPRFFSWCSKIATAHKDENIIGVSSHSWTLMRLANRLAMAKGVPFIYEPHELETETNGQLWWHQIWAVWTERKYLANAAKVIVVSDSIADWYTRKYHLSRPLVIRNIPAFRGGIVPTKEESPLRHKLSIPEGAKIFLYLGALFRGRRLEQFLRVFRNLKSPDHLVVMGRGELENEVKIAAKENSNIHFHPAVPPSEVLKFAAGADVGLVGVENVCLSYYFSLPNKLFECLASGLPVLCPDFPEMRRIVESFKCGWTAGDKDVDWANAIVGLNTSSIKLAGIAASRCAAELSWEKEELALIKAYQAVLSHSIV